MAKIVIDVVADTIDDTRLDELYRFGVDEVSYRKVTATSRWWLTTTATGPSCG
ncbi:MAG: hypothetical protein ACRD6W_04690 [Nitrososphaerales archaeon]